MHTYQTARSFSVIYYVGGTDRGQWRVTLPCHQTYENAIIFAQTINKQGYYTLIHSTKQLESIGLPDGAPNDLLQWQHNNNCMKSYCKCVELGLAI